MTTVPQGHESSDRHEIFYDHPACRDLDALTGDIYERIDRTIFELGANPRPSGCVKLGGGMYRVKVGDWRVIYVVDDSAKQVIISRVKRRNERTYRGL